MAESLGDNRERRQIPTANIFLCVFGMFAFRIRSFNSLEQELRRKGRWERWCGARKPSADTIGRVLSKFNCEDLRKILSEANRSAWRSKSMHMAIVDSYRVVAIDGHELFSSTSRCCSGCSTREVKDGDRTVVQYYHRVVLAQHVGVTPPAILDLEMIRPGEGEVVAARRLVKRICASYSRLIDVITADALYLEAPFIRCVLESGKHVVIVMKQENRDLFDDANRLRMVSVPEVVKNNGKTSKIWDMENLDSFTTLGRRVRVVWAQESRENRVRVGGVLKQESCENRWVWVTDLPSSTVSAQNIQRWGHYRWDIENKAFNELATHWHADHCFKHDTNAIEAVLLILALAFLFTYLFYERNLKPQARKYLTRLSITDRLIEGLSNLTTTPIWGLLRPG